MPNTPVPKYEFELWINGVQVGDITRLAKDRRYTLRRNASESLSFNMDLRAFEDYCEQAGREPNEMLMPYVTDVRVKRNGVYLFGTEVCDAPYNLAVGGVTVEVKAAGFLDLFKDRYLTKTYTAEEATDIVRDAIAETQSASVLDDFGVVQGETQETVSTPRDREYVDQNIRDLIVNLTNLEDGNFDVRFNYDRTFEIFQQQGSNRPGNKFTYPYNITGGGIPNSALNLYNYIIGLGSGFGEETLRSVVADAVSRGNFKTRQKIVSFNSVTVQETLDDNTNAYLQRVKDLLMLPKIKVPGEFCNLSVIGIGDRVPVEVLGYRSIPVNGTTYRIEEIDVSLDENDAEDISLTVDDYGL